MFSPVFTSSKHFTPIMLRFIQRSCSSYLYSCEEHRFAEDTTDRLTVLANKLIG